MCYATTFYVTSFYFASFLKDYPNAIVIGTDGSGNPAFLNKEDKVLLFDHDENKEIVVAKSFATYLENTYTIRKFIDLPISTFTNCISHFIKVLKL